MNHLGFAVSFALGLCLLQVNAWSATRTGEQIYQDTCARCHGPAGEGVAGQHNEALYGTRSVEDLSDLIRRTMPEDKPKSLSKKDSKAVAEYIHGAFYSPEARARMNPARIELAHLTNRQFRESVADLIAGFKQRRSAQQKGGLKGEYYQSDGMNKKAKKAFERQDARMAFSFGDGSPGEEIKPDQFSIAWQGSLLAPDTGVYEFRLTTPNGARFYINSDLRPGDANLRDDSDARRHSASLDLWVSSGMEREATTRLFLLGGRSYPLRLDFFKYKETNAAVRLEWKPPHGEWAVMDGEHLSPESSPTVAVVGTVFPADDGSVGYERGTTLSLEWQEKITQAALETASQVVEQLSAISGVGEKAENRKEKLQQFGINFAERAFRRPLTEELKDQYVYRHFKDAPTLEIAVKRVVLLVLTSPRFLYPGMDAEVDSYTVASRLALNLWDSIPDHALRDAARKGELVNYDAARKQAERMMNDPRTRAKLREFFHHWLLMGEGEDMTKDTQEYPKFSPAVVAALRRSLDTFVAHVVESDASDYRELLTADYIFLNSTLADYYGAAGEFTESEFKPVVLDSGKRAGVFSHPYLLSHLSYHKSTSPIHRGVFLTRNVLGRFLRPPPQAISFMDDRFDPSLTMREKVTELTKSDTCMACHVTINPLGFSLENFDATGRWRSEDNNKPVNSESLYTAADGTRIRLRGVRDLAQHAVTAREARLGFIRQLFHHVVKQTPAAYHPETMNDFDAMFLDSNCHMRNLYLEIGLFAATFDLEEPTQIKP